MNKSTIRDVDDQFQHIINKTNLVSTKWLAEQTGISRTTIYRIRHKGHRDWASIEKVRRAIESLTDGE